MSATVLEFESLGTPWRIDIWNLPSQSRLDNIGQGIHLLLETFDRDYSRFRADSLVSSIAKQAGTFTMPDSAGELFSLYHNLYQLTGGAFTPLIGQTLSDAGYDASYSLKQHRPLVAPPNWDDVMTYTHPILTTTQPLLLDVGAAGKGYAVDLVADLLRTHGCSSFCVDASGDLRYERAGMPAVIGLQDPSDVTRIIGTVALEAGSSLCGSAGSQRKWQHFTHLIDPRTLTSPTEILATWVASSSTIVADAIATCLFFVPPEQLVHHYQFEYLVLDRSMAAHHSAGFAADLFQPA